MTPTVRFTIKAIHPRVGRYLKRQEKRVRPRLRHASRGASPHPPSRSSPRPGGGLVSGTPHVEPALIPSPSRSSHRPGGGLASGTPHAEPALIPSPSRSSPRLGGGSLSRTAHVDRGSEQDTLEHCQLALPAQLCYNLLRPRRCSSGVPNLFGPAPREDENRLRQIGDSHTGSPAMVYLTPCTHARRCRAASGRHWMNCTLT